MINPLLRLFPTFFKKKNDLVPLKQEDLSPKVNLANELRVLGNKQNGFNHEQIVLIGAVWFNLDLTSKIYKFRQHQKYGQFFAISSVAVDWSNTPGEIDDMRFIMYDAAYETSFQFHLSVKHFNEWLEPVRQNQNPSSDKPVAKIG